MINVRMGNLDDIPGILSLQQKYLFSNMEASEREKGFVTTPFTPTQIEGLLQQNGVFIAEHDNNEIVAYAFAGSWTYFQQWEIFNFMVSRFNELSFRGHQITTTNSFQYGPVCIDERYRSQGVLNQLFECMRVEFYKKHPFSLTFINKVNVVSEKAHTQKLGWEILEEFQFNDNQYFTLTFDMSKSVVKQK